MAETPDDETLVHDSARGRSEPAGTQSIEIPGYRILERLGEGGMGAVFLAEEIALGRQVAIKIVSDRIARDSEIRARFLREARLLATVEHPNVVRVYTFGEVDGRAYLVMEYVEGETLAERIRRDGPMSPENALAAVRSIADALSTAWEEKVVHRDIKPSNILYDKRGRLRVADFGLAKGLEGATDSSLTQTGYLLGSPHYVAPEQAQGREADFRSDIYSLGIVLFEMLTARKPFDGTTAVAVVAKHLHESLPDVRILAPEVPDEIARLITWMAAKEPGGRPQSYEELLRALQSPDLTPTQRLHASPPVAPSGARTPVAAIAVGIVFVLALVFFVQRRARQPRVEANDGRIAVAVAPFYGPDAESLKEGRYMASMIEKAVVSKLGEEVRLIGAERVGEPIRDHDAARAIGERLGASAVIWGEAYALPRETQIQPSVTIIPRRRKVEAMATPESGGDPYVAMQRTTSTLRVGSDATNQVEMRKISADGIGDLVTFVVASHALREQNDPRKALALLAQMRATADSQYFKALARASMREDAAAERELSVALNLDPQHGQALALLADLDIRAGRWADAIAHVNAARASGRAFTSTEGTAFDGKVYLRETYRNFFGKPTDSANLLAVDPASGRVVERYRLGGVPRTFEVADDALLVRYDIGRNDRPVLETVRFSKGAFDPPQHSTGHPVVRIHSIRPGWMAASNFLWAAGLRAEKTPRPTFSLDPDPKERNPAFPLTLADMKAALETQIERDPTYPGTHVYLGLALWELGDRAGAEREWSLALGDGFATTPYYDYAWYARHLEAYGHARWADRAYEQARKRRMLLRDPISTSLQAERLIDAPFVRAAGFAARHGGDPARQYQWLERTRVISGVSLDAEDLAAHAWARWFRSKGDLKAAAREESFAKRAAEVSAYFDWLGVADMGNPAIVAFAAVALLTLLTSLAGALRRERSAAGAIRGITRGQRIAICACLAAVLLLVLVHLVAFRKLALYGLVPLTLGDAVGSPLNASLLDDALRANPSDELRFATAVSHHLAGHGSRATELYGRLGDDPRVRDNVDALKGGRAPEHVPVAADIVRSITAMRAGLLLADAIAIFRSADDQNPFEVRIRTGSTIFLGAAILLLLLAGAFSSFAAADRTWSLRAAQLSCGAALLLFAVLAWTLHARASVQAGGRSVPGFLTQDAMPPLANIFPLPPMPTVDATERAAWSASTPMRMFRVVVFGAAFAGAVLIALAASYLLRARSRMILPRWNRSGASSV